MAKINAFNKQVGWIEVICGPMFSGKTEELLRKINLLQYADVKYILFKPSIDTRFGIENVKSRDGRNKQSVSVKSSYEIIEHLKSLKDKPQVIAIDEAQFFDDNLASVCDELASSKYIIYVAGLDTDYSGKPFFNMGQLLSIAEEVVKLKAICTLCGAPACKTQRLNITKNDKTIQIGDSDKYAARCRHHHTTKPL